MTVTIQKEASGRVCAVVDHGGLPVPNVAPPGITILQVADTWEFAAKACGKFHDGTTGKIYDDAAKTKQSADAPALTAAP